ncbi:hypothetical protein, partial [Streptococcus sp. S784/96/1]|uniref:hypothetical protein n=1 Tax=Streptococcus sp. S784/96/1 TaxID=2653499 RepID=UPI001EE4D239
KNLGSKTSNTQKPHSDSFILIVFETEITVWFYFEASFCPASFRLDVSDLHNSPTLFLCVTIIDIPLAIQSFKSAMLCHLS